VSVYHESGSGPAYTFNGRTYKTVAGLSRALFADSGCDSHSMVKDGCITCHAGTVRILRTSRAWGLL
jgi:hypothetical protein